MIVPPPASFKPLEFNKQGLIDITNAILEPFGIGSEFEDNVGPVFDQVAIDPTKKVLGFLIGLAKQRNLIIADTPSGKLLYRKSVKTGSPVAVLRQGEQPLISVSPRFNAQQFYSHITGIEPVSIISNGKQFTKKNPHLNGVIRPFTFRVIDVKKADVNTAINAKMGRMFGSVVVYSITLNTWRDPSGTLWSPNTTIKLQAHRVMIYTEYEFIIKSVKFIRTGDIKTAILSLVLPGSFNGETPERLPWDD